MERRNFLKGTLITMGSLLLGAKAIHRFLNDKEPEESPLPPVIDRIHQGDKKKCTRHNECRNQAR